MMNLNIGCIETRLKDLRLKSDLTMNLNIGCIETPLDVVRQ